MAEATTDHIDYKRLVSEAMRGLVRAALRQVEREGLPGEHHFYITYATRHPEVRIPKTLVDQYPDEMTIVLQHQFWELRVDERGFAVTLGFGAARTPLYVGFDAVLRFVDPHAQFGIELEPAPPPPSPGPPSQPEPGDEAPAPEGTHSGNVARIDRFRKR